VHPTLPDGQVITGKNTLQSFPAGGQLYRQTPSDLPDNIPDDAKRSLNDDEGPNTIAATPPPSATVVAVAVDDDTVYAILVPEPLPGPVAMNQDGNSSIAAAIKSPWYKARTTIFTLLIIVAISLSIVLGLSIGLSNGSSEETLRNNNSIPSTVPVNNLPTTSPITSMPTNASVPIAFDPNITLRATVLTSYINTITLSNRTITANGTSPESKALAWMIANDTSLDTSALISVDESISTSSIGFRIRQRFPLLVMWFQQNETAQWAITTGWLMDISECAWYGISCKPLVVTQGSTPYNVGSENVVTQVTFNLVGSFAGFIPHDIGLLSSLEHFEIKNTKDALTENGSYLHGTLPDTIGQWTALTYLDVSLNDLTGSLPDSIGNWTALTYFDISDNYGLNGALPDSIGQWTAMTHFDVSYTVLNGSLPYSIGQWTALTYFVISGSDISGTLPDTIDQWTDLTYFDVNGNYLNGTLPNGIGKWIVLENFDVNW
jgi:hypothetical protein